MQRRTLPNNAAVPGTQAYSDDQGRMWFDLGQVHVALSGFGYPPDWRYFRKDLRAMCRAPKRVQDTTGRGIGTIELHFGG